MAILSKRKAVCRIDKKNTEKRRYNNYMEGALRTGSGT